MCVSRGAQPGVAEGSHPTILVPCLLGTPLADARTVQCCLPRICVPCAVWTQFFGLRTRPHTERESRARIVLREAAVTRCEGVVSVHDVVSFVRTS